jgi:hypothetical protein
MRVASRMRLSPTIARMAVTQIRHVRRRAHLGWIAVAALFSLAAAFGAPSNAQAQVTVTLTSSPNPSVYGNPVTFTATVAPSTTSGTITFRDSLTNMCINVSISNGTATCVKSNLFAGAHTLITARFNGVPAVTSAPDTQLVYRTPTSTSLTSDINPSEFGEGVRLTAQVTPVPATPPARMQFYSDGGQLATASVSTLTGIATANNVNNLTPPGHTMTAVYPGDNNLEPSTSPAYFQTVTRGRTATCVAAPSPNPVACGQLVTLKATVAPIRPSGQAEGPVQFLVNGSSNGVPSADLVAGVATAEYSTTFAGTLTIDATYQGNAVYLNSTASTSCTTQSLTVNKGLSSVTVTSDINPSFSGQTVRFTATVQPSSTSGLVTFRDSLRVIATRSVSNGIAFVDVPSSGVPALLPGFRTAITAAYLGDACFDSSRSAPYGSTLGYDHRVNSAPTTLTVTTDINPSVYGQNLKITATVVPINAAGRVEFYRTSQSCPGSPPVTERLPGTPNVNTLTGLASILVNNILPGHHQLQAKFVPSNQLNAPSVSPLYDQFIEHAVSTTVLSSNANPSLFGEPVDLIATVSHNLPPDLQTAPDAAQDPGPCAVQPMVQFFQAGDPNPIGQSDVGPGGVAIFTVSGLPEGTTTFTAMYVGNFIFSTSTSLPYDQDVVLALAHQTRLSQVVTKLTAESFESGVRVSWTANRIAFKNLELQRAIATTGPWRKVDADVREDQGSMVAEDITAGPGRTYFYRVLGTTTSGNQSIFGPIEGTAAAPRDFALSGAWPNPTHGALTTAISLPKASNVRVSVLDLQGREVAVLADGGFPAGRHELRWDGRTGGGKAAAGLYFIRLITPEKKFVSRVAIAY